MWWWTGVRPQHLESAINTQVYNRTIYIDTYPGTLFRRCTASRYHISQTTMQGSVPGFGTPLKLSHMEQDTPYLEYMPVAKEREGGREEERTKREGRRAEEKKHRLYRESA